VLYFFARLRIDLQIDIFGIIAQDSDFPEIALQNCKSDMITPLNPVANSILKNIRVLLEFLDKHKTCLKRAGVS
jgi:hypothetical protein